MILKIVCDSSLNSIFYITKNILNVIMIIAPILEIIALILLFVSMLKNPEDKKILFKIRNSILALFIIFMIPVFLNVVMSLIGESTSLSSCWNHSQAIDVNHSEYYEVEEKEKKSILTGSDEYEPGVPKNLDFSCTSSTVKAQFSCQTLRIVEKHLYDVNAQNFYSVINSYGGFEDYAKSLGGVFGEYYGKTISGRETTDFQKAAEYVIGWMYMYGWDYMNGSGEHAKWGGSKYTPDAFYVNGGWERKYTGGFDDLISGKNGVHMMSSECGDLEVFIYSKLGISRKKQLPKVTRLKDLKVGDGIYFFDHRVDKSSEKNWGIGTHNVVVGEVYEDRIVCYDTGRYFQENQNYKRTVWLPEEDSEESDYAAIQKTFGYAGWGMRRWYNFED